MDTTWILHGYYHPRARNGKTMKLLKLARTHHPKADADIIYLPRKEKNIWYSIRKQAETYRKELDIPYLKFTENESDTAFAKRAQASAKKQPKVRIAQKWEEKSLHGKYPTGSN